LPVRRRCVARKDEEGRLEVVLIRVIVFQWNELPDGILG